MAITGAPPNAYFSPHFAGFGKNPLGPPGPRRRLSEKLKKKKRKEKEANKRNVSSVLASVAQEVARAKQKAEINRVKRDRYGTVPSGYFGAEQTYSPNSVDYGSPMRSLAFPINKANEGEGTEKKKKRKYVKTEEEKSPGQKQAEEAMRREIMADRERERERYIDQRIEAAEKEQKKKQTERDRYIDQRIEAAEREQAERLRKMEKRYQRVKAALGVAEQTGDENRASALRKELEKLEKMLGIYRKRRRKKEAK